MEETQTELQAVCVTNKCSNEQSYLQLLPRPGKFHGHGRHGRRRRRRRTIVARKTA